MGIIILLLLFGSALDGLLVMFTLAFSFHFMLLGFF